MLFDGGFSIYLRLIFYSYKSMNNAFIAHSTMATVRVLCDRQDRFASLSFHLQSSVCVRKTMDAVHD